MRDALVAVADGIVFTWRLGAALVRAVIAGVVGMVAGFIIFALLGLLAPEGWGSAVWSLGIFASGIVTAVLAFLAAFRRPAMPDVMGSAAWASARGRGGAGRVRPRP